MTAVTKTARYDYAGCDGETVEYVRSRSEQIHQLAKRTAQSIVQIGENLIAIKARLPHGEFGRYLDMEFGWTDRTAQRFIGVATHFKSDNLSDLNIGASALYTLTAPSAPAAAREEAIQRAEQGERVTHSDAKQIVAAHYASVESLEKDAEAAATQQPARTTEVFRRAGEGWFYVCADCEEDSEKVAVREDGSLACVICGAIDAADLVELPEEARMVVESADFEPQPIAYGDILHRHHVGATADRVLHKTTKVVVVSERTFEVNGDGGWRTYEYRDLGDGGIWHTSADESLAALRRETEVEVSAMENEIDRLTARLAIARRVLAACENAA